MNARGLDGYLERDLGESHAGIDRWMDRGYWMLHRGVTSG